MTTGIEETRAGLRETLDRAEAWLRRVATLPETPADWEARALQDADGVRQLRTRASSALINVALLGAFSSGKSFLLSGLQHKLKLLEVEQPDGSVAEKFVGLLPSSPVPTTACPATVLPVDPEDRPGGDADERRFLRVQFMDAAEDEWEDIGDRPPPAVVAAYAMHDAEITNRLEPHWTRDVAEIEIQISPYTLPAKLYDLPGYGSPNAVHDRIVEQAMGDADCFLYVSHASRSLSENDLALIRFLYQHHRVSKKRVVWVVTAIDTATQLDLRDIPAWRATIDRNNAYLREKFTVDGRPDLGFIGEGFVPASPASEARGALIEDPGRARRLTDGSHMAALRETLGGLIEQETGRRRMGKVADEARGLLGRRFSSLAERLRTERLPIEALENELAELATRAREVEEAIPLIREDLEKRLRDYVKRAARSFNGLSAHLHAALDERIRTTDVRRPAKAHEIQRDLFLAKRSWVEAEPDGPAAVWADLLEQFRKEAVRMVRSRLGADDAAGRLPDYTVDFSELDLPRPRQARTSTEDLVQRTAAFLGISAPIVATGSWMGGMVTAGIAFPPAAAVLGLSALVYMGVQRHRDRATSLEVTQQEWIDGLDTEAQQVREAFELAIGLKGTGVLENLEFNLLKYLEELEESAERVRERMARPETQGRQEFVEVLSTVVDEGRAVIASLRDTALAD
ncbi:dynamin family protein [Streptomyces sp. NBC_01803]|uniref:dynamin family protein n=1 Tax=Streptomyces sp. NBC_01803 TaxID=2975946 RepID=UPI002DDAF8BD|nr:dynamin family protein [Streptomyces sp. NBC_01803]WSA43645.1 dynamin family protein [Streptomyces sp. NBC_01803]